MMTAAELKLSLTKQLRALALWWGRKTAACAREQQYWESMDAMLALANAVAAVPDTHPALEDLASLPLGSSDALPTTIPNSVLLGAYGFAAFTGGGVDTFLDWMARTMRARWSELA